MRLKQLWVDFIKFVKLIHKDHPSIVWIIITGGLAGALQPFIQLVFSSRILDKVLAGYYKECITEVVLLLTLILAANLIAKACGQSVHVLGEACNDAIYLRTANKAYQMEYEEFEKTETMDAIRRVRGSENGSGGIASQIRSILLLSEQLFSCIFSFVFVVMLMLRADSEGGSFFASSGSTLVVILIFGAVMAGCIKVSRKPYKKFYEMSKANEHFNSVGNYLISAATNYQNGKDIRIYSMQKLMDAYYKDSIRQADNFYLKFGVSNGSYTGILMLITQLAAGMLYVVIGLKAIYGIISIGEVLMYAGAVLQLSDSLRSAIMTFFSFKLRAEYLSTYYEFINKPDMHYTGTLPVEKRSDAEYEFALEHVSFHYPGTEDMILKDISLKFKVGEKFAVVGRNGAGKTTLIKLLCRLYEPTEGRILLNGIDIKYYDYNEYTKIFSVVFQDFKLLSLPLGDNVSAGEEIDEERMWKVLEQVGLKERVRELPKGLYTQLYKNNGEGVEISGGEAQKLAIARALYKDGPFVILDEPTAALDPIAEEQIYEHFNEMINGKTAIYISHRMSSCKFCDDIVVLDEGRITERGNHESLLRLNGIYASLYNTQAQYYAS